jgi:hypothetical protein
VIKVLAGSSEEKPLRLPPCFTLPVPENGSDSMRSFSPVSESSAGPMMSMSSVLFEEECTGPDFSPGMAHAAS